MKNYTSIIPASNMNILSAETFIDFRDNNFIGTEYRFCWLSNPGTYEGYHRFVNSNNYVNLNGDSGIYHKKYAFEITNLPEEIEDGKFFAYGIVFHKHGDKAISDVSKKCDSYIDIMDKLNNAKERTNMTVCAHCGEKIDFENEDFIVVDGEIYCGSDCVGNAGYVCCEDCEEWVPENDVYYIEGEDKTICSSCYDNGDYFTCIECGDHYHDDDRYGSYRDGGYVCNHCADYGDFVNCEDCGYVVRVDDAHYDDDNECYYCDHCYEEREDSILSYHDSRCNYNTKYYVDSDGNESSTTMRTSSTRFMGFELEIDNGERPRELIHYVNENYANKIYCCHDGSLNDNGIELISIPATLEWHIKYGNYKPLLDKALFEHDYEDGARSTGLHVHINKFSFGANDEAQKESISKLILLVNKFWDKRIVPFTRRVAYNLDRWAKKNSFNIGDVTEIVNNVYGATYRQYDRYQAVNLTNSSTVELRIFRGTLNYNTLISTLQFVDLLCEVATRISYDELDALTWVEMTKDVTEPLKTYIAEHVPNDVDPEFVFIQKLTKYRLLTFDELKKKANVFNDDFVAFKHYCLYREWSHAGYGKVGYFNTETKRFRIEGESEDTGLYYELEMFEEVM